MTDTLKTSNAQAIIDAVTGLAACDVHTIGTDERYIVLPKDKTMHSLKPLIDSFRHKPERRRGTITVSTETSFVDIVKRFADPKLTSIFARRDFKEPSLLAVFDYHEDRISDVDRAQWTDHRAKYSFPLSKEWKRWFERNGTGMASGDFAAFVEDNILDVATFGSDLASDGAMQALSELTGGRFASPSQLMDLSRGLAVNVNTQVKQARNLSSGEIHVTYAEVHNDGEGRPINVPNLFIIGIPIFDGGVRYRMAARLRYRIANGGGIIWSYSIVQPERSFDHAFDEVVARVKEAVAVPVFYGAPES